MKNIYLYNPVICEGDYCPMDCDRCPKADEALKLQEEEEESELSNNK